MDKRYQAFVSSTYDDLQQERQEVMQALLELDCIPSGMELFPAANEDQWTLIKKVIDECDYYIVILAGRYGSVGPDGESYTEMEYKYADSIGKPIIAFLHKDLASIPAGKSETEPEKREKLQKFREHTKKKMCKYWKTPDELGSVVSRSMIKLMKSTPAVGWVRANDISDPEMSKENLTLRKRVEELESELNSIGSTAPAGTENLAQGDDIYVLKFKITTREQQQDGMAHYFSPPNYKHENYEIEATWNDIIKCVLPHCIPECDEDAIRGAIQNDFRAIPKSIQDLLNKGWELYGNRLDDSSLKDIIIQLKVLGIILPSIKKRRSLTDSSKYWALSKYGEGLMDKLCAIHKPVEHG